MLLPSAIQRSDDFVGIATPMVPLSPLRGVTAAPASRKAQGQSGAGDCCDQPAH